MLEVSRQSISKWETDSAVPDLEKLIKLSDIFGVSLDSLVKGENPQTAEQKPQIVIQQSKLNGREIAMIILFCTGTLALILVSLLGGMLAGLLLASPFIACGIVCAVCKKRPFLFCCWVIYLFVRLYLMHATGTAPNILTAMLIAGNLNITIHFILALIEIFAYIGLIIWTVYSYRNLSFPLKGRPLAAVITTAATIILSYIAADLLAREQYRQLGSAVNYAEMQPWITVYLIANTVIDILRILSLPILTVNVAGAIKHRRLSKKS